MKTIRNIRLHNSNGTKARVVEKEIDGNIIQSNFEMINDKFLDDMGLLNDPNIRAEFSDIPYEKTYHFSSVKDIEKFVSNSEHKESMQKFLTDNKFLYSTWDARVPAKFTIPSDLMIKLLEFTSEIYDEVTIPYWNFDLADYQNIWDYAVKNIPNSLASWVDLKNNDIISIAPILSKIERLNTAKFGFGKFSTHFMKYAFVLQNFSNKPVNLHLNGCSIRTSINKSNTATSQAAILLGFNSTTRLCLPKRETKKNFFPTDSDVFDTATCRYVKKDNKQLKADLSYKGNYIFRKVRSLNIINSNKELKLSSEKILNGDYKAYYLSKEGLVENAKALSIS